MGEIKRGFIIFILFSVLTGLMYPVIITGLAQVFWKDKANGSLIVSNKKVIGSKLIGQKFTSPQYFHARPSAIDYKGNISGASNLGPTSSKLIENAQKEINSVRSENALGKDSKIPADLVLSSASGLDPHISLDSALLQAPRIAKIRGITLDKMNKLIYKNLEEPLFKFLGQKRVNVLTLNLELEKE
ncbi:MAG: potassium-transporting ATPase subunit KdpC [Candidatus Melainabacteria bacterium]|nr:potassium-transporting ATPase subunit KdpC [Candidatus Melainabacteria bacterium]MBI3309347.1 potassium-transporting ATPase subunit KdpC [Candidatus Melainabacteria bacterium]